MAAIGSHLSFELLRDRGDHHGDRGDHHGDRGDHSAAGYRVRGSFIAGNMILTLTLTHPPNPNPNPDPEPDPNPGTKPDPNDPGGKGKSHRAEGSRRHVTTFPSP